MSSRGSGIYMVGSNIETIHEDTISSNNSSSNSDKNSVSIAKSSIIGSNMAAKSGRSSPVNLENACKDIPSYIKWSTDPKLIKSIGSSATKKTGGTKYESATKKSPIIEEVQTQRE